MRFLGYTFIPTQQIQQALSTIYGIGNYRAKLMCLSLGISPNCKINALPTPIWNEFQMKISKNRYLVTGELRKFIKQALSKYKELGNYKALQFKYGYPIHGQRTHTNAQTAKRNSDTQFLRKIK